MSSPSELAEFLEELRQDLLARASLAGEERLLPTAFAERVLEDLVDIGEVDDGEPCYLAGEGFSVSGYDINEDEGRLDLFVALFSGAIVPEKVPVGRVNDAITGALAFFDLARHGLHRTLGGSFSRVRHGPPHSRDGKRRTNPHLRHR